MPVREPEEWAELKLGRGVRLLLGWRDGAHGLEARPVRVSDGIGNELVEACKSMLSRIGGLEPRIYSGIPAIESDQYLSLGIEPETAGDDGEPTWLLPQEMAATAELLGIIDGAFEAEDWLSRAELEGGFWLFYVVVVELEDAGSGEVVAFVRKYNPQRGFSAGRLQVSARGSTLVRVDDPLFNFDFKFDLVVAPDEIAILSVSAFNSVFADIEVSKLHVPENATAVATGLALALADGSEDVLGLVCGQRASFANRLRRLAHADHLGRVDKAEMRKALKRHKYSANRLGDGSLVLRNQDDVELLFDLLEGLLYEADFTEEGRRAVRYTVR